MQFDQPPLIELVAELRWLAVSGQGPSNLSPTIPHPILATPPQEEFFHDFSRVTALSGWTASERMLPVGFPLINFQPVLRIRSLKETESQMLYQVGPGVFSANALPPYKNWESFQPFAARGLDFLLKARIPAERQNNFFNVALRYLDVFTPALIGDMSIGKFLTDILGFSLSLPPVLSRQIKAGGEAEPHILLRLPLASDLLMTLQIANGIVGDNKGIVMNTEVTSQKEIAPNRDAVLAVWEQAHSAIRETFVGLTTTIHAKMKPLQG